MLTTTILPTGGSARLAGLRRRTRAARGPSGRAASSSRRPSSTGPQRTPATSTMHARLWGVPRPTAERRIDELVEAFGLGELIDRPVGTYSGGQRRRLEIARALVSDPQVLFLDEPTVGLDTRIRYELLDLIAGLRAASEHDDRCSRRTTSTRPSVCATGSAIVHAGRIVALDTPARLLAGLGERDRRAPRRPTIRSVRARAPARPWDRRRRRVRRRRDADHPAPRRRRRSRRHRRARHVRCRDRGGRPRAGPPSTTSTSG